METVMSNKTDLRKFSQFQAQGQNMSLSCDVAAMVTGFRGRNTDMPAKH